MPIWCFPCILGVEAPSNLAENQPTWQTSTSFGGEAFHAVDGRLAADYGDGSCTHTNVGPAIWGVDLGGLAEIHYVEVLNRADHPG